MVIEPPESDNLGPMTLHLIKLCVGCDSVHELEDWIRQKLKDKRKRGEKPEHIHRTRMVPKRAEELIDGGSLYWVIRGEIMCRQRLRRCGRSATRTASDAAASCSIPRWCWSSRGPIARSRAGAISPPRMRRAISPRPRAGRRRHAGEVRRELRELGLM